MSVISILVMRNTLSHLLVTLYTVYRYTGVLRGSIPLLPYSMSDHSHSNLIPYTGEC